MMTVLRILGFGLLACLATGCKCESALGRKAASHFRSPDEATAEKLTREGLKKSPELAWRLCGVDADGFEVEEIKISKSVVPGIGEATVKGRPINPRPGDGGSRDAGAAKKDAGPGKDAGTVKDAGVAKAAKDAGAKSDAGEKDGGVDLFAVCSGVLGYTAVAVTDAAGNITEWTLTAFEAEEVTTPGHEWTKPPSSGGGHDWD